MYVSADIQYFAVPNRVYFLSNNVGIHFVFTYYFRLVPMFSSITPKSKIVETDLGSHIRSIHIHDRSLSWLSADISIKT